MTPSAACSTPRMLGRSVSDEESSISMSNSIALERSSPCGGSSPASIPSPAEIRGASELLAAEIDAIPLAETVPVNLDPTVATTVAMGVAPAFDALLPQLERLVPSEILAPARKLRACALALMGAHLEYELERRSSEPVQQHMSRLMRLRARFGEEVRPLLFHGTISPHELAGLRGTTGHKAILHDVALYTAVFRHHWAAIHFHSTLTEAVLDEADELVGQGFVLLGRRERPPKREAFLRRQRAFTLFIRSYSEVRRLVTFLRFHLKDADTIAPSLYARRRKRAGVLGGGRAPSPPEAPAPSWTEPSKAQQAGGAPTFHAAPAAPASLPAPCRASRSLSRHRGCRSGRSPYRRRSLRPPPSAPAPAALPGPPRAAPLPPSRGRPSVAPPRAARRSGASR